MGFLGGVGWLRTSLFTRSGFRWSDFSAGGLLRALVLTSFVGDDSLSTLSTGFGAARAGEDCEPTSGSSLVDVSVGSGRTGLF